MRANTALANEAPSSGGEELYLGHDLTTATGAYGAAKVVTARILMLIRGDLKTTDAALYWLSKKYNLGTLPKKLIYDEPANVRADQFFRLQKALETALKEQRVKLDHLEKISSMMRTIV